MIIRYEKPPCWDRAITELGATESTLFTFGDIIYVPSGMPPTPDLEVHENVHSLQQASGVDEWWNQYFRLEGFRYEQELAAYRAQFRYIKTVLKDRNAQMRFAVNIAGLLAGPMYGKIVDFHTALRAIRI